MAATNLAIALAGALNTTSWGAVVESHVHLELFGIGIRGWFPAGFLSCGVEVVRKVLGVRVTNLPSCWKTSFDLLRDTDVSPRALRRDDPAKRQTIVKLDIENMERIKYKERFKVSISP